jgi:hypothetical protein
MPDRDQDRTFRLDLLEETPVRQMSKGRLIWLSVLFAILATVIGYFWYCNPSDREAMYLFLVCTGFTVYCLWNLYVKWDIPTGLPTKRSR